MRWRWRVRAMLSMKPQAGNVSAGERSRPDHVVHRGLVRVTGPGECGSAGQPGIGKATDRSHVGLVGDRA
ncbi:hypothetical protein OIE61_06680 [Streptomyces sp. NBC_01762]|uniref:hypothetical protein n=1 Tax=unclassified Streptomyces TaxID=2593676 RepID=UPI002DD92EE6|nr:MULTISPECIES: hypothetical protein [unclassified Streptomyces]WSC43664.1 hypothetical protein OIE61_06680 [Streptomyces sp. NBC_01762]WSD23200.1 hypothetical protein OHA26_06740 [Streptomyces sp. NBC_01751]